MTKQLLFVYITICLSFGCGEDLDNADTMNSGDTGQPSGTPLSQEGKLNLPRCDQIASGDQSACETTIYQLKDPAASPTIPDGSRIALIGVVTGLRMNADNAYSHLTLAVPANALEYEGSDYGSVWIYLNNADVETLGETPPSVGSYIQIIGSVKTHYGQRQLEKVEQVVALSATAQIPPPVAVMPTDIAINGPRAWQLEGTLVTVANVTVSNPSPTPGPGDGLDNAPTYEFELQGGLIVNDFIYAGLPQPAAGDTFTQITGFLRYANDTFKLEPRSASDIF